MQIQTQKDQGYLIVGISGRLDSVSASEFDTAAKKWLEEGESQVILDLRQLDYISSAGLRVILALAKKLKSSQGSLSWCGLSEMVQDVICCAGFDSFIPIFPDSRSAMSAG